MAYEATGSAVVKPNMVCFGDMKLNPEKPDVPLNKNDAYKKNSEPGPILHDQSPPFFFHLNPL